MHACVCVACVVCIARVVCVSVCAFLCAAILSDMEIKHEQLGVVALLPLSL